MSLLDAVRRVRDAARAPRPATAPSAPFFGAGYGASGAAETVNTAAPPLSPAERSAGPVPGAGAPLVGLERPLPPLDPVPFLVHEAAGTPMFTGPANVTDWLASENAHVSHGALVTEYDHEALLANYDVKHQVGRGPRPGGS